jgi:hypothetical protein
VWTRNYGYDAWGNGWVTANSGVYLDSNTPGGSSNFDTNNRLNAATWTYDSAGNQLTTGSGSFSKTYL